MPNTPRVTFHIDPVALGHLFKLEVERMEYQRTLSGRPYIVLVAKAPSGYQDGETLHGTVKEHLNGSITLGLKKG